MRTHFCGLVDEALLGHNVTLCGWTDVARNLGGVCFIDLRDHEGVVQVVVEPDQAALFEIAASLGYEDVLRVVGSVREGDGASGSQGESPVPEACRARTSRVSTRVTRMASFGQAWTHAGASPSASLPWQRSHLRTMPRRAENRGTS